MRSEVSREEMIPLPLAAARCAMTWGQIYNALLSGKLRGERRGARWWVSRGSVEELFRERASADHAD